MISFGGLVIFIAVLLATPLPCYEGRFLLTSSCIDTWIEATNLIPAPWNIDDEPIPITSVTERAARCGNMYGEVGRLDEYVRPNPIHQFLQPLE